MAFPKPRGGPVKAAPEPIQSPAPVAQPQPVPPIEAAGFNGVEPQMISSLPPMASGADVYARQYYRGSQVPFRRYLPLKGL